MLNCSIFQYKPPLPKFTNINLFISFKSGKEWFLCAPNAKGKLLSGVIYLLHFVSFPKPLMTDRDIYVFLSKRG